MEKTIKEIIVHKGDFIDIYEDEIEVLNNQNRSKRIYAKHPGGSAIIALSSDNKILLTSQYRYAVKDVVIEIPAGKKDSKEEDGILCAKRELEEETKYQSNDIKLVFTTYACVGYSDEILNIYLASNIYLVEDAKKADDDEFIEVKFYTKSEAKYLLETNQVKDMKTIVAIQYYLANF